MGSLDHFPQPEAEYDPQKFMRDFMLMDAAFALIEQNIKDLMKKGTDIEKIAALFVEKKALLDHMLAFIASAYFISSGRVKLIPAFRSGSEFAFPYKGEELWARITNKISEEDDELADEIDKKAAIAEPVAEVADSIARAIILRIQQIEQEDS